MIEIKGKKFLNETVHIDGKTLIDCIFENCSIVYSGGDLPSMVGCNMDPKCRIAFEGAAGRTIVLMHSMNNGGFRATIYETIKKLISPEPL